MKKIFVARLINQSKDHIYLISKSRWKWFQNSPLSVIKRFLLSRLHIPFWNQIFMEWKGSIIDFREIQKISSLNKSVLSKNIKDYSLFHKPIEFMTGKTMEGLYIQPPLLIPRSDTITWLNEAINMINNDIFDSFQHDHPLNILEFGVGSGIIPKLFHNNYGYNNEECNSRSKSNIIYTGID